MRNVRISDLTMKQSMMTKEISLSFKEKLELAKLLDRLGVNVIEAEGVEKVKIDSLRLKSLASAIKSSVLAAPVKLDKENIELTWAAIKDAVHPRLQVVAAVSTAQMEYIHRRKAPQMLEDIKSSVAACKALCDDVEFIADDATRSDTKFLYNAIKEAIANGATTITVCDVDGGMLPDQFGSFIDSLYEAVPELKDVTLGVGCSDSLSMADACAVTAVLKGAGELKAVSCTAEKTMLSGIKLDKIVKVLATKEDVCNAHCSVRTTQLKRVVSQIQWMCDTGSNKSTSLFESGVEGAEAREDFVLTSHDDISAVTKAVEQLGYDFSDDDLMIVYESFQRIAQKKECVTGRELDAIIASDALQVPPTYVLDSYVINSGNKISATAFMRLKKNDEYLEAVSIGDGPVHAAFLAIEEIVGSHYELEDFQIRSVSENHEAMGETVVKLRSEGKLYSGRGTSIDIVGSSIRAFINALNKIVYEEQE